MNRYKKSSGSKYQWRPAKAPAAFNSSLPTQPSSTVSSQTKTENKECIAADVPVPVQTLNTYLGPRGYTIPKSELSETQLKDIRKTLTVRPVTGGGAFGAADTVVLGSIGNSSGGRQKRGRRAAAAPGHPRSLAAVPV